MTANFHVSLLHALSVIAARFFPGELDKVSVDYLAQASPGPAPRLRSPARAARDETDHILIPARLIESGNVNLDFHRPKPRTADDKPNADNEKASEPRILDLASTLAYSLPSFITVKTIPASATDGAAPGRQKLFGYSPQLAEEARKVGIQGICAKADSECVVERLTTILDDRVYFKNWPHGLVLDSRSEFWERRRSAIR